MGPTHVQIQELRDEIEQKANYNQVPTHQAFQQLQNTVATKAAADQVPTNQAFQQLQNTVATKAAADQVPTNQAFQLLQKEVATKVAANQVPANRSFRQLQKEVATQAAANEVPTNQALQHRQKTVATKAADDRGNNIYCAKLAEQVERYDEMAEHMEAAGNSGEELGVEERNLLSVAYEKAVSSRRAALRIITGVEQTEKAKGNDTHAGFAKEYCVKVEAELENICDTILKLLDTKLIPQTPAGESKVFYVRMKADYYRYMAEFTSGNKKDEALKDAKAAYAEATALAEKELVVTHPVRLGLALNYSVFMYEILNKDEDACNMARCVFEDAIAELVGGTVVFDDVAEDNYKDSTSIMRVLRDNLVLWTSDLEGGTDT